MIGNNGPKFWSESEPLNSLIYKSVCRQTGIATRARPGSPTRNE